MKREIKFRAWDGKRNRFSYFLLHQFGIDIPVESYYPVILHRSDDDELYRLGYDNIEFSQYTGLKDKNGKEIYEGDICRTRDSKVYEDGYLSELLICNNFNKFIYQVMYSEDHSGLNGYTQKDLEVIGNIYENSDLLK